MSLHSTNLDREGGDSAMVPESGSDKLEKVQVGMKSEGGMGGPL